MSRFKPNSRFYRIPLFLLIVICHLPATAASLWADEGMWLFNKLPIKQLASDHGFMPDQEWIDHLMLSSVRFNSGGSASFVSSNGLVLTNHHVAAETLYKLSSAERNIMEDGFLAGSFDQELKAPDLELNQLVAIEDVTDQVNSVIDEAMSATDAAKARQAKIAEVEQQSLEATGLRSDVVTLYGGARYHLYRYKKYTDVRLVWAPESGTAFFGGDADNFEYPRYCLDVTLFRVYENDEPAHLEHFLKVNPRGATKGDLVFVSGNPGRTRRTYTHEALVYQRDDSMPFVLDLLRRKEVLLQQFSMEGPEQERIARDDLFGIQNSRKAYTGMLAGLQDPSFMESKKSQEAQLLKRLKADSDLANLATAWDAIANVQQRRREQHHQFGSLRTNLYSIAERIVLLVQEDAKPNAERLAAYRDSGRESLEQSLFSPAPLYADLERVQLADELARFIESRGGNDPLCSELLSGKSPRDRASEVVAGTKLFDVSFRRELAAAGLNAVESSNDPMIQLARTLNSEYRRLYEENEELSEIERQAYAQVVEGKFAIEGDSVYPDATFTLRLAYGVVSGYELDGKEVPEYTTMGGSFDHERTHEAKDPWILPESWHNAKERMDQSTPFNFVCTADIIGGNSGSPVVSKDGELVGVIFDGNIQSLTSDFYYTSHISRSVCVHIAAVLESLESIYDAKGLVEQIGK